MSDLQVETVERRRCFRCNGTMYQRRRKRSFFRYINVFRCNQCRRLFEQETRGFQGFYIGVLITLTSPFLYGFSKSNDILVVEIILFSLLLLLASWPIYINTAHYLRAQVLSKGSDYALCGGSFTFWENILGGNCRVRGVWLGIATTIFLALVFGVSAFVIVIAVMNVAAGF